MSCQYYSISSPRSSSDGTQTSLTTIAMPLGAPRVLVGRGVRSRRSAASSNSGGVRGVADGRRARPRTSRCSIPSAIPTAHPRMRHRRSVCQPIGRHQRRPETAEQRAASPPEVVVIRKAGSTGATTAVSPNVCPVATTPTSRGGPLGPDGGGVLWDEPGERCDRTSDHPCARRRLRVSDSTRMSSTSPMVRCWVMASRSGR